MDQNQRKKDALKRGIEKKKNQEIACIEKRVVLLKSIHSEQAMKDIEKRLKAKHPFESISHSQERNGSFRMFVTYPTATMAANALSYLRSVSYLWKGIFVALASPSKAVKKAEQKHNAKVIDELVEVRVDVVSYG